MRTAALENNLAVHFDNLGGTTFVASLDVAKPSVVSRILTYMWIHWHVVAALLEEMKDGRGTACFENSETEFRCSRCIRQGGVEAAVFVVPGSRMCSAESRDEMESQKLECCVRERRR